MMRAIEVQVLNYSDDQEIYCGDQLLITLKMWCSGVQEMITLMMWCSDYQWMISLMMWCCGD